MINNPRKFAITWLLEPTEQEVEPHYEYVFRLVTYHGQEITIKTRDETRINTSKSNHYLLTNALSPDFPIIRAKIYKVTKTREYLGTVEYFGLDCWEEYTLYNNSATGITEKNTKYVYLVNSMYLSQGVTSQGLTSYKTGEVLTHKVVDKMIKSDTEELVYETIIEQVIPSEVFTAEFHSFSDDTFFNFSRSSSYSKVVLTGISYPKFQQTTKSTRIDPDRITESTEIDEFDAQTNGKISFTVYSPYTKYIDNFDKYQDKLYTPLDSKISAPAVLVKCSDGLDFATFKLIGNETQYFSKNTTITFEHD